MNFVSKWINKGFGTLFFFVIICAAVYLYNACDKHSDFALPAVIMVIAISLGICYCLHKLEKYLYTRESICIKLLYFLPLILLVIQIIFAALVEFNPINDLSYICKGAENYVKYGVDSIFNGLPKRHQKYFYVYTNNNMLLLIITGLYKISYKLTGETSDILPTIINILALNISYIFMIASAKLLYNPSKACICALRGLMFTPLITYAAFFYTDSLAMPFVSAGIYVYIKCRREEKTKKRIILLIICGVILALGYKIKGSVIIILAAIFVDMFLHRYSAKEILKRLSSILLVFAITVSMLNIVSLKVLNTSKEEICKYEFPKIHWIMMSADGKGGYNKDDFLYTQSFEGYSNKVSADFKRLGEKLKAQGVSGFAIHIFNKIGYTWREGTYMVPYYYSGDKFLNSVVFMAIAEILHFSLLFKVLQGFISKSKEQNDVISESLFLKISLAGLFLFLLLWEARCRYLVSFMALFALI